MSNILPFESGLASHFRDLNLQWLEAYFYVEAHDKELLDNCEATIIDKGGYIFFYKEGEEIIGTFALIKVSSSVYELGKMAVDSKERGRGIGQKMMHYCINFARKMGWTKLILYSNTSLSNSIHLYRKNGFHEIPIETDNPYARGNIKMEFNVKNDI